MIPTNDNAPVETSQENNSTLKKPVEFSTLYNIIINQLEENLPAHLTYHSAAHTVSVVEATEKLAETEHIDEEETLLLKTAALFHDTGFLRTYKNHEEASCSIARENLPGYGFSDEQVDVVCRIIMATKLPYHPVGKLQQIICDADLDYLGRSDFFRIGDGLRREFLHYQIISSNEEWEKLQIKFLSNHHYHTESCKKSRETKKQHNIVQLL